MMQNYFCSPFSDEHREKPYNSHNGSQLRKAKAKGVPKGVEGYWLWESHCSLGAISVFWS